MILLTVAAGPGSIRIRSAGTRAARSGWPGPSAHRETRGHHVRLPARAICGRSTRSVFWGAEPTAAIGRPLQPWLDYLIRLGCNGLALNPIFAPETHGYDVVDYLRIDPRLGDDGDVEWLVDACHRRAIRVLFDGVFTHVGRSFPASGRVYAVLASKETVTGPLTIQYRTATGGVGEAQVAWVVEPLRGTRRIRVTREEIRLRLTASPLTVVVSADHIEVESAPQRFPTGQRLAEPGEPGRLRPEPGRPGGPHQPRPSTGSSTRSRNSCGFRRAPPRGLDGACLACHQNDDLECVAGAFTGFGYVGIAGRIGAQGGHRPQVPAPPLRRGQLEDTVGERGQEFVLTGASLLGGQSWGSAGTGGGGHRGEPFSG